MPHPVKHLEKVSKCQNFLSHSLCGDFYYLFWRGQHGRYRLSLAGETPLRMSKRFASRSPFVTRPRYILSRVFCRFQACCSFDFVWRVTLEDFFSNRFSSTSCFYVCLNGGITFEFLRLFMPCVATEPNHILYTAGQSNPVRLRPVGPVQKFVCF